MSKLDAIMSENPDLSLDDLVTTRKINADQKAQALKKPALQAQLAHYEEQLVMAKEIDEHYASKLEAQKAKYEAELENVREEHKTELAAARESAAPAAAPEPTQVSDALKSFKLRFLTLTRFLRAAAARRQIESSEPDDPSQAFEGVLLALYGGDSNAVFAAEKLINGSEDLVASPDGTVTSLTCKTADFQRLLCPKTCSRYAGPRPRPQGDTLPRRRSLRANRSRLRIQPTNRARKHREPRRNDRSRARSLPSCRGYRYLGHGPNRSPRRSH
jgi:hypothetical protein